ncbi:hypothetical protein B0H10DRAFT_1950002 [Mycena sp. CBHHK59/15]|nr:hypothetical protein B0H10DRAFT_1950002 [Mycena sp. CBHHK59/15]
MTCNRRAKSLPLNFYRFPKATRQGLTGTKRTCRVPFRPKNWRPFLDAPYLINKSSPSTNAQHIPVPVACPTSPDFVLDITVPVTVVGWVADLELPEVFEIFPRIEKGRLYLRLDDFEATFKRRGFGTDIELYLGDGYMAWIAWPLYQPLPIDGPNEIAILRSRGVNYLEGWNNHL